MAQRYAFQGVLTDASGNVVATATLKVYDVGTSNYATIYAAKTGGAAIDQDASPIQTDGDGLWKFFVSDTDYPFLSEFKQSGCSSFSHSSSYSDSSHINVGERYSCLY
jgi:hypothetical protein